MIKSIKIDVVIEPCLKRGFLSNYFILFSRNLFGQITFLEESNEQGRENEKNTYAFYYGWIMTVIYMFIVNIVLLNLLIAMLK